MAFEDPSETSQDLDFVLSETQAHDLERRYGLRWSKPLASSGAATAESGLLTGEIHLTVNLEAGEWPRRATLVIGWETPADDDAAHEAITQLRGFLTELGAEEFGVEERG